MIVKFCILEQTHGQTHGLRLHVKCRLDRFVLSPTGGEKKHKFCRFLDFGILWCRQLAAIGKRWTGVHNYRPSPIQRYQNHFCTPMPSWQNRAHKRWHSKAWWTDRQNSTFWPPRRFSH